MATTEWCERYSVGIKELDEQHRRLFSIFYSLLEADDTPQGWLQVLDLLGSLKAYTHEHFELEERYMANCRYPELEGHRRIHDTFRKKVEVLCSTKSAKQEENLMYIISSLYEWLITHVCSCDQLYTPYVTGQVTSTI